MPSMAVLGRYRDRGLGLCAADPGCSPTGCSISLLAGIDDVQQWQPGRLVRACCSFRSRCSACIRRSQSVCCSAIAKHSGRGIGHRLRRSTRSAASSARLATTFYLIPLMGSRAITLSLGNWRDRCRPGADRGRRDCARRARLRLLLAAVVAACGLTRQIRSRRGPDRSRRSREQMLKRKDGQIDHIETHL